MDKNFNCDICNFSCKYESIWKQHISTKKHNNKGVLTRKSRTIKLCYICNFKAEHKESLNTHILTKHKNKEDRENEFTYYCKKCDFGTFIKILFDKHNSTIKHNQRLSK